MCCQISIFVRILLFTSAISTFANLWGHCDLVRIVVGFIFTYAISSYYHNVQTCIQYHITICDNSDLRQIGCAHFLHQQNGPLQHDGILVESDVKHPYPTYV